MKNSKIEIVYLKEATRIHKSFLNLQSKILGQEEKLSVVKKNLDDISKKLKDSSDKMVINKDKGELQVILKLMDELTVQGDKIKGVMDPIHVDLGKLRKNEAVLYNTIKENTRI